jgi:hypothetical protein
MYGHVKGARKIECTALVRALGLSVSDEMAQIFCSELHSAPGAIK